MTPCRSCALCERELSAVRLELQAVVRERDQYRDALADLLEGAEDMRTYVDRYFAEKWEHDDYLARARAALSRERKDTNA